MGIGTVILGGISLGELYTIKQSQTTVYIVVTCFYAFFLQHFTHTHTHTHTHTALLYEKEVPHTKQFIFADILCIFAGLLYLLCASYGGCVWTWRTPFIPNACRKTFLPVAIIAWLLSLTHAALVAAFITVMINYGSNIIAYPLKFKLNLLSLWTLGGLVVWVVLFLTGMIPTTILFRRKYKPHSTQA